jgi:hypothetical protein
VSILAKDTAGLATWSGSYRWSEYSQEEMIIRALKDVPKWIINNNPNLLAQEFFMKGIKG